ncbi:endo-1,4-beta-xylanase [Mobilitalea sibirica]|uniref:Beta-xylanase n=1 Tax=Mobilitalea sibirica TaxID=1462919 RepID=A0A8J7KWZ7_9FIRM|nr:endo-1,4-beta-xylanase [Mobilitalea sibirica]MBH1941142.1 endo-1,4-beta-xylanase [Mobilitalea sibirica]
MAGLKDKYRDYFKIGAAVNTRTINTHAKLITEHFNSLTCENETKFISLQKEEDNFNFRQADKIVQFARDNHLAMRGHTFTWHNQTPGWVFENATKEKLLDRLKTHIRVVGQRYEKDFYCWDVVNEAIEDKTELYMRKSPWTEIIGEDFMDYAFLFAKEILPGADLYYNDYNEVKQPKRDKIYKAVKDMIDRGIPVDGVGLQCHWSIYSPSADHIKSAIEQYAKLGLKIQVTEMDISMFSHEDKTGIQKPTEKLIEQQAKAYGDAFAIFREYKDIIDNVTLWGVADDETWLDNFPVKERKNWPLLFDEQQQPKEAYYRIMDF